MPEYLISAIAAGVLGWCGFAWRKAETAHEAARIASDAVDKLELKVAEKYLSKSEFELSMDRLFKTLGRFEEKLDFHVFKQAEDIRILRDRLHQRAGDHQENNNG